MGKIPHDPDEILAIVDSDDHIVGRATRRAVHLNGHKHREASVLIVNSKNEILLQTRMDSGRLDYSASGHFPYNQGYLKAAVREVSEELGLRIPKSRFVKIGKFMLNARDGSNYRFVTLFEVRGDYKISKMRIDRGEVASVKYYSPGKIRSMIGKKPEKGGFAELMDFYLKRATGT
jgi:isopentenyl-diphosphate Delta-isomerase